MTGFESVILGLGAAWSSGINLYATTVLLGGLHAIGLIDLPPSLHLLSDPAVLAVLLGLYLIEFVIDKIPGLDSLWDGLHTVIRVPAGALLAAAALGGGGPESVAMLVAGGLLAATSHLVKTGTRAFVNMSPEPFSNTLVSLAEDVLVVAGVAVMILFPLLSLVGLAAMVVLAAWLLPRLWKGLRWLLFDRRRSTGAGRRTPRLGAPRRLGGTSLPR